MVVYLQLIYSWCICFCWLFAAPLFSPSHNPLLLLPCIAEAHLSIKLFCKLPIPLFVPHLGKCMNNGSSMKQGRGSCFSVVLRPDKVLHHRRRASESWRDTLWLYYSQAATLLTGRSIKSMGKKRRCIPVTVTTGWKSPFQSAFMYKCIKLISESGSALSLTGIHCLCHFQCLASADVLYTIDTLLAPLTITKKHVALYYHVCIEYIIIWVVYLNFVRLGLCLIHCPW